MIPSSNPLSPSTSYVRDSLILPGLHPTSRYSGFGENWVYAGLGDGRYIFLLGNRRASVPREGMRNRMVEDQFMSFELQ
ncbi:hypothetical protein PENTCL1PPCAC_22224, partial [Pristionchus entomophagus]